MPRHKEPPFGFRCLYEHHCPYLQGLSTQAVFYQYQRAHFIEHDFWRLREEQEKENRALLQTVREQESEIDRLKAELKTLHQRQFKAKKKPGTTTSSDSEESKPTGKKKRGAPVGHPPWNRKKPDRVDRKVVIEPPDSCPHCHALTNCSQIGTSSYMQEDIVWRPQTVVTEYVHHQAWCPTCRRLVSQHLEGELPNAPIGPNAKAAALYLRYGLNVPYRKIQTAMKTLFNIDFVPASTLGFEKRARKNADPLFEDLIEKMRHSDLVHADETHWREDGAGCQVWYGGNQDVAVFRIDAHRSTEAAQRLLGNRIDGLLVTDAYAAYNAIEVLARQSCLAHLIRKARELSDNLDAMKQPDPLSIRFCKNIRRLLSLACRKKIPPGQPEKDQLKKRLFNVLESICSTPLEYVKAETLRKRLIPGAREYNELFPFIDFEGPPTNNHAERALRPLVIFRKVCMGTRSATGSENIGIFTSLTQTAKLQDAPLVPLFQTLLTGTVTQAQDALFPNAASAENS